MTESSKHQKTAICVAEYLVAISNALYGDVIDAQEPTVSVCVNTHRDEIVNISVHIDTENGDDTLTGHSEREVIIQVREYLTDHPILVKYDKVSPVVTHFAEGSLDNQSFFKGFTKSTDTSHKCVTLGEESVSVTTLCRQWDLDFNSTLDQSVALHVYHAMSVHGHETVGRLLYAFADLTQDVSFDSEFMDGAFQITTATLGLPFSEMPDDVIPQCIKALASIGHNLVSVSSPVQYSVAEDLVMQR